MKQKLQSDLKVAMKSQDKVKVDTIRLLVAALQYEEMQKKVDVLPDDAATSVLQRELARRKEEVEFAEKAKREDLKEKLAVEISILEAYLPKQLSVGELEKILTDLKATQPGLSMGVAMKNLKEKYAGQYDGKLASDVAKRVLG